MNATLLKTTLTLASLIFFATVNAAVHYVDVNSTNAVAPYTNWTTAANIIQDAIDVALSGDEVVVTNGVYETGGRVIYERMQNRIAVTKPITVRSVNGPDVTVIRGYQLPGTTNGNGAIRCAYLTNGATLAGFTLTNGATRSSTTFWGLFAQRGGGAWCESTSAVLSNCVLIGNSTPPRTLLRYCDGSSGGDASGLFCDNFTGGGGVFRGTLYDCRLINNFAAFGGGALLSVLNKCTLTGNFAATGGGAFGGTLNNCVLIENSAYYGGGACDSKLKNCLVNSNSAVVSGGGIMSSGSLPGREPELQNCTITGNSACLEGGGVWVEIACSEGGCPLTFRVESSIAYGNTAPLGANHVGFETSQFGAQMAFSCTTPLPTNGFGNITNAPLFVDPTARDFRLQSNSPCINAGRNTNAPTGLDLGSNARIVGPTMDIGAYEFQFPLSTISYAWLQQYNLPTDGASDFVDSDGDGLNNWQEWRAWTDPTNSLSTLRLLSPIAGTNGIQIQWQSAAGQSYFLERSSNFGAKPAFAPLASNLVSQAGTTVFTDTNAVGVGPFFYRVGVRE